MLGGTVMEKKLILNNKKQLNVSLLRALDKGIDDFENGRVVPHEQAMEMVHQRLTDHVQNTRNNRSNK